MAAVGPGRSMMKAQTAMLKFLVGSAIPKLQGSREEVVEVMLAICW